MPKHAGALTSREHTLSMHAQEKARDQGQSARKTRPGQVVSLV